MKNNPLKTCPVVLRGDSILAFRHPLAGLQLVKGGMEPSETPEAAASRELFEEAGATLAAGWQLGVSDAIFPGQTWYFVRMKDSSAGLPKTWQHDTQDDGGHRFSFFWQPLSVQEPEGFDPRFHRAIAFVRTSLQLEGN